jgi:hypothetical protein
LIYLKSFFKNEFQNKNNQEKMDIDGVSINNNTKPTILQISNVLGCFVDAHFTHITLSDRAQEIVADVLILIQMQLDIFTDLLNVESIIKESKINKENLLKKPNIGNYYIEVLKFS